MSPSAPSQMSSDVVLAEAIEEITNRLQARESVDIESYVQKHPEYAERLRQLLPALVLLDDLSRSHSPAPGGGGTESPEGPLCGTLGDFRILREVGRGGMGVVYEAEQISLRRRVALKVLPFAATMDSRHLQRFHNEAQAAACLHHTNIVPVHFVGCERGVHFYAMQFIDGQPLSEIIRQLGRLEKKAPSAGEEQTVAYQPSSDGDAASTPPVAAITPLTGEGRRSRDYYRKVAELGVQAAEALDHAHQLGIVHRDIKPANLLLDGSGNLWVTDFGLAHVQHGEASLTGTGQMVGTPRYMSPEQALAKRVPIDHRTDVYSLGATLYELMTLRPAFASEDREELLRQIAFEEPARPRRVERGIPAELEIIVLKAMEKRPPDRYATAQELADDLRHWLEDRPIRARRPSWAQVARRWARRHQSAVRAASLLMVVFLAFGFVFSLWWVKKHTEAETEARAALQEAERWQQEEKWSEALSAIRRAQGILRGFGADPVLQQQVDDLGKDLEMVPRLEEALLQKTAIKEENFDFEACISSYRKTFAWYGFDLEHGDAGKAAEFIRSRSIAMQLVAALDYWVHCLRQTGKDQEWKHLLAVARAADPDEWRNRFRDAWEHLDGKAMNDLLASAEVEKLLPSTLSLLGGFFTKQTSISSERAAALLRRAVQLHPADFWTNHVLAGLLLNTQPPQLEEAIRHYMIAVALRPHSPVAHFGLGVALKEKGQLDEAIAEYHEVIRLKKDFALAHFNLGAALHAKGQVDEAMAEYREAIRLNKVHPDTHFNLGNALRGKGQLDDAIAEYREAIRFNKDHVSAHGNLGIALHAKGQVDEAIAEYHEVIRLKKDDALAHNNLGDALAGKGHLDQAIAEFRQAIRLKKDFAEAYGNLGEALARKGRFTEALECHRRGHELGSKNPRWPYPSAQWVRNCERLVQLDANLPAVLHGQKQPADTVERLGLAQLCQLPCKQQYAAALRFYNEAFTEKPQLADDLNAQHRYNAACAAALAGCGQGKDADKLDPKERARLRQQAHDWLRADLKAYRQLLEKSAGKAGPAIAQRMQHWLTDGDFAGVRGDEALAKLPAEERAAWRNLWADATEMLAETQGKKAVERKPEAKSPPPR